MAHTGHLSRGRSRIGKTVVTVVFALTLVSVPALPASATTSSFADVASQPGLHQGHADVLRLYWAFFDREPEPEGAQYWIDRYDSGAWSTTRISEFFSVSAEFTETYGSLTDADFVELMYQNILGRQADDGGVTYWAGQLGDGKSRGEVMADFSFSLEFRQANPLPSDGKPNTGPTVALPADGQFCGTGTIDKAGQSQFGHDHWEIRLPDTPCGPYAPGAPDCGWGGLSFWNAAGQPVTVAASNLDRIANAPDLYVTAGTQLNSQRIAWVGLTPVCFVGEPIVGTEWFFRLRYTADPANDAAPGTNCGHMSRDSEVVAVGDRNELLMFWLRLPAEHEAPDGCPSDLRDLNSVIDTCTSVVLAYDEVALEIDLAAVNLQAILGEQLVELAPVELVGLSDQQIHQSNLVGSNVAMITAQTICQTDSGTTISDRVFYTAS